MNIFSKWWNKFLRPGEPKPKHQVRICSECGKHIKRTHKWFYFVDGVQHKDCTNPTLAPAQTPIPE